MHQITSNANENQIIVKINQDQTDHLKFVSDLFKIN